MQARSSGDGVAPPTVEDRIAIQELMARYVWSLDTGDMGSLVACFVPDARIVDIHGNLPKNSSDKIQKNLLRAAFHNGGG
jgi:acyl-coenzyme A synthetase/AMP-(fatty) acid ligase